VRAFAEQRAVLGFDAIGFILGLGHVIGLRSSLTCVPVARFRIWCSFP
jgi:hypothetical protein